MFEIPVSSNPNQNFRCTIPIDGENKELRFCLIYNGEAGYWIMSVTDGITGQMLIDSLPLIAGIHPSSNLLEQYAFLQLGSLFIIKVNPDNESVLPDGKNLGTDFKLIWGDTVE